jgi:hypothetical protein
MLHYYHGYLLKHLQQVKDYQLRQLFSYVTGELQTVSISEKVSSALATLKAAVQAVLDGLPGQQSQDSPITESLIDTLQQALTAWRTQVGAPEMHFYTKRNASVPVYVPAPGEDNEVIYEVTQLVRECETYSESIRAVLPKARAQVPPKVGNPGASIHALLRQLDALK